MNLGRRFLLIRCGRCSEPSDFLIGGLSLFCPGEAREQFRLRMDPKLMVDVVPMPLDRALGKRETLRDRAVLHPLTDQPQDLGFPVTHLFKGIERLTSRKPAV